MDINPNKQNIEKLFSGTKYSIDFYQREYKWNTKEVKTLLDDVFYRFNLQYNEDLEPSTKNIAEEYDWYYLGTYVTNSSGGETFIVDGQQRLTTFALILISLYHKCKELGVNEEKRDWVKGKISGSTAEGRKFYMGYKERARVLENLFASPESSPTDKPPTITETNMYENYIFIDSFLTENLGTKHKLETFLYFFLKRMVLVELDVGKTDVPMVFEVINDRGVRLKPYEILKGKLLGQIHKNEVEEYNEIWESGTSELEKIKDKDLVDGFFRTYLKSECARSRAEARRFDGSYQRVVFEKPYKERFQFKDNPQAIKNFLENEFTYYVNLYKKILKFSNDFSGEYRYLFFNSFLNRMDSQEMIILSACELNDPQEEEKVKKVSELLDKAYVLLQLNKSYDSNQFTEMAYEIMKKLDNAELFQYDEIFEEAMLNQINEKRSTNVTSPYQYNFFREVGYQDFNTTFLRYFFARVEYFISKGINREMQEGFWDLTRARGETNAYHVEHILGRNNKKNLSLFGDDDEVFERERNRLGGLLLLKGRDNQSSGNEDYKEKLGTYASTLYWNQSLTKDFYKSKLDIRDFMSKYSLNFEPVEKFDQEALEKRSRLLFEIVKIIWA